LGPRPPVTKKSAVVSDSEYDTVPEIGVAPCRTVNVVVVIEFGFIGVLKVAVIILSAAIFAKPVALLVLYRDTLPTPSAGDVRITVGAMVTLQGVTIPGSSSLQPLIKTTKSKAAVSPAESGTPRNPRIVREKCVHRFKAVVGFVVEVFMDPSVIS
jgi:hypothetical protein